MYNEFTANLCTLIQLAWVAAATVWILKRGDEIPLLVATLLAYVFSFRFWALVWGWAGGVDISNFGFQVVTLEEAADVLPIAVLGETMLLGAYMLSQKARVPHGKITAPIELLSWLRHKVFVIACLCIPLAIAARLFTSRELSAGKVMAFESSAYIYLFPFVLISVAILLAILWKAGGLQTFGQQFIAGAIVVCIAALTFQPGTRFQFLGWILASTIILSSGVTLGRKIMLITTGVAAAIAVFAVAGALRNAWDPEADLQQNAWERFAFAQDANMLDGFVLLREVYPALLPFDYGRAHLEIFERAIPRAWWPDKPVGGYMNKLGLTSVNTGGTLGISPSLFGSFYQEGAVPAVVLLSLLYGAAFGRFVRFSTRISPIAGVLMRGILCAFLVPLLRGGDLPGIYAWGFMAFWPCLLIFWLKRRELFQREPEFGRTDHLHPVVTSEAWISSRHSP